MVGLVESYTIRYNFAKVRFDTVGWHSIEHDNWTLLDALLSTVSGLTPSKGVWRNSTAYAVGDRIVESETGIGYVCLVANTSSAVGLFAAERVAFPTYWNVSSNVPAYRGAWVTATTYNFNEIVLINNAYYLCVFTHVSGVFATDLAAMRWTLIVDTTAAINSVTASAASAAAALTSKNNATTSETNAGNSATAANTSATNAGTSESNALAYRNTANTAATNASNSAASALASFNSLDVRYLGSKSSNPTLDNAGNALLVGALYWNTIVPETRSWSGTAWVSFGPTSALVKTNNLSDLTDVSAARKALAVPRADVAAYMGLCVNPFMEFDQENLGASVSVGPYTYVLDQMLSQKSGSLTLAAQGVATPFSGVSGFKRFQRGLKATVGTAQASFASGDYVTPFFTIIEGSKLRGLGWGTSDAVDIDIVSVVQLPAGTYSVSCQNGTLNRSYVTSFTVAANIPTLIRVTIPGDTGGTWATDTSVGMRISIAAYTGTTYQASALGVWANGSYLTHSSCNNFAAVTANIGICAYINAFVKGVLPTFSQGDTLILDTICSMRRPYDDEFRNCERFLQYQAVTARLPASAALQFLDLEIILRTLMRATPSIAIGTVGLRSNLNNVTITDAKASGGRLSITSAASGDTYVIGDIYKFSARY